MNNFGKPSADLDFGQSISTCLKKYAVFEGRAKIEKVSNVLISM